MIAKSTSLLALIPLLASATSPVLEHVAITPNTVDVTSGGQFITLQLQASDDVAVDRFGVSFDIPGRSLGWQVGQASRIAGTAQSGTYELQVFLPAFLPPGVMNADVVVFDDQNNASAYWQHGLPFPAGSTNSLTVVNTGPVDSDPPILESLSFEPSTLTPSDTPVTVDVTLTASDDHSGIKSGGLTFFDPDYRYLTQGSFTDFNRVSGDSQKGTYTFQVTFPSVPEGPMDLVSDIRIVDHSEASALYGDHEPRLPYPGGSARLKVADTSPPVLHSFTLTPDPVDVSGGAQTVTVTAVASDRSGVDRIAFSLRSPGRPLDYAMIGFDRVSGDALSGTYETTITIPTNLPAGPVPVDVRLFDTENNVATHDSADITIVNTGEVDAAPPTLDRITFEPAVLTPTDQPTTLTVTIDASDDVSGVSYLILTIFDRNQLVLTRGFDAATRTAGDAHAGTYSFEVTLPSVPAGAHYDTYLTVLDHSEQAASTGTASTFPDGTILPFVSPDPLEAYDVWITSWRRLADDQRAFGSDPDQDGISNGLEFLLDMNPSVPDLGSDSAPRTLLTEDTFGIAAQISVANLSIGAGTAATLRCEFSTDGKTWTPSSSPSGSSDTALEFTRRRPAGGVLLARLVAELL